MVGAQSGCVHQVGEEFLVHGLAATAAELAPVRHRPADKIDKNPAELRFVALA